MRWLGANCCAALRNQRWRWRWNQSRCTASALATTAAQATLNDGVSTLGMFVSTHPRFTTCSFQPSLADTATPSWHEAHRELPAALWRVLVGQFQKVGLRR